MSINVISKQTSRSSIFKVQEVILVTSSNGREGGSLIQRWIPSRFWLSTASSDQTRILCINFIELFGPRWKQRTFLQPLGILVVLMFLIALNGVDCPLNFYGPSMFSQFGWNTILSGTVKLLTNRFRWSIPISQRINCLGSVFSISWILLWIFFSNDLSSSSGSLCLLDCLHV